MNTNENRKYYIPACHYSTGLPQEHPRRELVEVDRETYLEYYRPIWRTHDSAIRNGGCNSFSWKLCTGDCPSCRHHLGGRDWSLEAHVEKTPVSAASGAPKGGASFFILPPVKRKRRRGTRPAGRRIPPRTEKNRSSDRRWHRRYAFFPGLRTDPDRCN